MGQQITLTRWKRNLDELVKQEHHDYKYSVGSTLDPSIKKKLMANMPFCITKCRRGLINQSDYSEIEYAVCFSQCESKQYEITKKQADWLIQEYELEGKRVEYLDFIEKDVKRIVCGKVIIETVTEAVPCSGMVYDDGRFKSKFGK